jgi:tyrosinase
MVNGTGVLTRYEAGSPEGVKALGHYAAAVKKMKERDSKDPTSWGYQAAIHGSTKFPKKDPWNQCEHQSWFFLPWHRMYLFFFEQIVRRAVVETKGPEDWTLPYWDYGPGGDSARLPEQFREPANEAANPLYVEARADYYNEGGRLPYEEPGSIVTAARALAAPSFLGSARFGGGDRNISGKPHFWGETGLLENSPHNGVHRELLGWMGDPKTAAQDPIFWLHHCNIDRIWAIWNEGKSRPNPGDDKWLDQTFTFFDISKNSMVDTRCGDVRETIAQLNYTYDPSPATSTVEEVMPTPPPPPPSGATPPPSEPKFVGASREPLPLTGEEAEATVRIDPRGREEVFEAVAPEGPTRLYLNLEDIRAEDDAGSVYGVYLNLPEKPSQEDRLRRYVGNVSFFGIEETGDPPGDSQPHGMRASFEVGPVVQKLQEETDWDQDEDPLRVTLAPIVAEQVEGVRAAPPGARKHSPVHIGRISVSVDA